jgi:hypothetical protein
LNKHSLSHPGTTEKTDLATTGIWRKEIDDFDTSNQNLSGGRLVDERRRFAVDGKFLLVLNWAALVDRITGNVLGSL